MGNLNKTLDGQTRGKKYTPFQYYATTGENDDEPSQLNSEYTNSTWDQKMEEELDRTTLMFQNFIQSHDLAKAKSQANFNDMMLGRSTTESVQWKEECNNTNAFECENTTTTEDT